MTTQKQGTVYIVGAGPGDSKLITLKGIECLQKADVVIYDLLLNHSLLEYCPAHTERIQAPDPRIRTTRQTELNQSLIHHAKSGKTVVRLKGGDPYIFGRGGEEALVLAEAGITFEVVPGITAAVAASAYAGIPVTHRNYASSVAFVTGHSAALKPDSNIDWERLATAVDTLVVYMGVAHLRQIVERLRGHGRTAQTPVSLIRVGTTPQQQVVQGTLADIVEKVEAAQLRSPAIIVVGEVNQLRAQLRWFDTKPLFGKRVLVTRARAQASGLADLLELNGAEVIQFPTIQIEPVAETARLASAIEILHEYTWIIFTSVNAVEIFYQRLRENGRDVRAFGTTSQICAVGSKTVEALNRIGIHPDFVPTQARGAAIAAELDNVTAQKILLPRAKIAPPDLPDSLRAKDAIVDEIPLYDTISVESGNRAAIAKHLLKGEIELATFTSSSTVTNFLEMFPTYTADVLLADVRVAVIGPTTQATAVAHGMRVDIVAKHATIEHLVESIVEMYQNRNCSPHHGHDA